MNRAGHKLLASALVAGALGSVVALGVFGLFSATTQNSGNEISAGTVAMSDNDAGSAQFSITGASPGDSWERCIKLSYSGSLPAEVRIYMSGGGGPIEPYLHLNLSQGTQPAATFPSCTGFTPDGTNGDGELYDGPSAALLGGDYETGLPVVPFGKPSWSTGDSLVFRSVITLSPEAPNFAQGATTGVFNVHGEARSGA